MEIRNLLHALLLCILTTTVAAQDFSGRWTGHYSYLQIKAIAESSTKIYGAAENAVFSYDIASKEIQKISTVNGLSGQKISSIYYSQSFEALVVGYENGIIEVVFDGNDDVFTVVDINEKASFIEIEKRINHFTEEGDILYISTNFGIIEFNLERLEFGDTFFIGSGNSKLAVAQTTIFEGNIFAVTNTAGVLMANQNSPNLIDSNLWSIVQAGNFSKIQAFGNNLYVAQNDNQILKYNGAAFVTEVDFGSEIISLQSNSSYLTATLADSIITYDTSFNQVSSIARNTTEISTTFTTSTSIDNTIYLGSESDGFFFTSFNSTTATSQINPSGPSLNIPRTVDAFEDNLWVAYGQYSFFYNPLGDNRGISYYNKATSQWKNIPKSEIFDATPITDIAINRNNPDQVFFGSFRNGLLEVRNQEPFKLYDAINTNPGGQIDPEKRLETIPIMGLPNDVRIRGLFFKNDELWFTISLVPGTGIKKYNPQSETFSSINFSSLLERDDMRFSDLVVSDTGTMFLGSYLDGVVTHKIGTNNFGSITNGLDDTTDIQAIALDKNDQLWVGTVNGLRILSNASNVFEQQNPILNDIVIRQDNINEQILNGEHIWDIKVDGSNKKWIATEDSGVFYFSEDGEEALAHFTTENSPLPSNFVQEIAIDDASGAVYFATQGGLVEYQGLATESNLNLDKLRAFPNPVRPGYNKLVTVDGLTEGANVKITDIEGNLVFEAVSQGGSVQWDTRAFGQHKVASGVYLVLVTGEELAETKVAKLMIVR